MGVVCVMLGGGQRLLSHRDSSISVRCFFRELNM